MSYLAPEARLSPQMFRLIYLTQRASIAYFAPLCARVLRAFSDSDGFLQFAEAFAGLAAQRFPLLAALLYYGRAAMLLKQRQKAFLEQFLLVVSYYLACEMYGVHVQLKTLSAMSGFSERRLGVGTLAVCEILHFELYIAEEQFSAFLDAFYRTEQSNDDFRQFLDGQIEDFVYAPRGVLMTPERRFEDEEWLKEHQLALHGQQRAESSEELYQDAFQAL